ncbi:MAG: hypothetical protein LBI94_03025, partial [Treponema sp.]|nr:hypothetical protein [Treponema sp.]
AGSKIGYFVTGSCSFSPYGLQNCGFHRLQFQNLTFWNCLNLHMFLRNVNRIKKRHQQFSFSMGKTSIKLLGVLPAGKKERLPIGSPLFFPAATPCYMFLASFHPLKKLKIA